MKLRLFTALSVALAAFALTAGSAFASGATFVAPVDGGTISQDTSFIVDTTGLSNVAGVDIYTNSTGSGDPLQSGFVGGWDNTNVLDHGQSVDLGNGRYRVDLGIAGWMNPVTNDTAPYPLTFVAVAVDGSGAQLGTVSENLTIDNSQAALVITSTAPGADSTVSGTFALTVTATDQNAITAYEYSVDNGSTWLPLSVVSPGVYRASINTVAAGIPNGDLYIEVRLSDEPGNVANNDAHTLHLVVASPHAPAITPGTLVAEKSLFRTDETQLEVGDIVTAYNMEATGYPAPVIRYLWNICRGQVCTGVTPGSDGDYTVQPADEGATLSLIATATNASGTDFTSVDFGVIAPAYVAPVVDPTPDPAPVAAPPAPPVAPPVVVPPVVVPPVVVPPAVTPVATVQGVTPAAQKAIDVAQQAVAAKTAVLAVAEKAKAVADQSLKTAQKKVDTAVNVLAAPTATATEKKHLVTTVQTLVVAKATATTATTATAKKAATQSVAIATQKVDAAVTVVSAGAATPNEKKQLVATVSKLVTAKTVAADKADAVKTATKQVAVAKQTLTAKKVAAKKP